MVILVQPMYSTQEINADSNYVVYSALIRAIQRIRPTWSWVIVFPDAASGFSYQPDGFFDLPNVVRVPQRISPCKMANAVSYDSSWYDRLFRKIGFNAVWCNLVEVAHHFQNVGESCFEARGRPLVIAAHNYVIHRTLPYVLDSMKPQLLAQLIGSLGADFNVFNSDHCQSMLMENAAKYLSAESVADIEQKSTRIDYGVLEDEWPASKRGTHPVPLIAYNHRLQQYKNYKDTFSALDEIYQRTPFKLRFMSNCTDHISNVQERPWAEVRLTNTRRDYLAALSECDLNITNSQHETFCIAAIESMRFGQPVVAPNGITFPQITSAASLNYPYLFDNREQQIGMIEQLLTDASKRREWGDKLQQHVMASYSHSLWAERYVDLFETLESTRVPNVAAEVRERATQLLDKPLETRAYYNELTAVRVNGKQSVSSQSFPLVKVLRLAQSCGGRAYLENGTQYIRGAQ